MKKKIFLFLAVALCLTGCAQKIKPYSEEIEYNNLKMEKKNVVKFKQKKDVIVVEANTFVKDSKKQNTKVSVKLNEKEILAFDELVGQVKITEIKDTYLIDFIAEMSQCTTHFAYLVDKDGTIISDISNDDDGRGLREIKYDQEIDNILATYTVCGMCQESDNFFGFTHKYEYVNKELSPVEYIGINCPEE